MAKDVRPADREREAQAKRARQRGGVPQEPVERAVIRPAESRVEKRG